MTFTYHLRSGLKWSDGQPMTAADAAWTLNFYKKYSPANFASDVALLKDAEAPDDTTLVIHSTVPTVLYSGKTVFLYDFILPEHIWGKYENDYRAAKRFANVPAVGSGPFIMTKYLKGQYVELDPNPYYWGDSVGLKPHMDQVIYRIYNNEDALAAAVANGEVDFAYFVSANIINTLKTKPGVTTRAAIVPSFGEIGLNGGSSFETNTTNGFSPHGDGAHALTDVRVRQAIRMAVDSDSLVKKVLQGYGEPAQSPVQPDAATGKWQPGPSAPDLSFNIANANALLDQAGYKMGPDGVRIDPTNGKPLEFRYYTRTSDPNTIAVAPFVQAWLKEIGIKVDIQSVTSTKLGNIIDAGTYDMFQWGWYPNVDPNYILDIFTCGERPPDANTYRPSDSYYCNPEYDKLYKAQQAESDFAKRTAIVHQMQDILYRDQPYIMLWYDAALEAWRSDRWTGFKAQPADGGDVLATYGPLSVDSIRPVVGSSSGSSSSGIPASVWILLVLAVLIVGFVILSRRRRAHAEDRD